MAFRDLAEKLFNAQTGAQRKSLLKNVPEADFLEIAFAVKEISYEFWTTEPTKTEKGAAVLENLAKRGSNTEILALANWIKGIAALTKGKLRSAIKNLNAAYDIFLRIDREHLAAQTQGSKLYALALLGCYDEANECGKKALQIFEKYKNEFSAGKIEINLGNIASRREFHDEAEKYYSSARRRFIKIGDKQNLAVSENSLAITYTAQNLFRKAELFYKNALARASEAGMFVTQAEIESSIGNLALFRGRFDEALQFLESARQKYESLKMPHQEAVAELEIADIYLELNLSVEAFEIYENLTKTLQRLKMQGEEARARANFGRVAILNNKKNLARRELKKAAKLYSAEKNRVGAAIVKLNEASLEFSAKNYRKTLELADQSAKLFAETKDWRRHLTASWLVGETLRNLEKFAEAERLLKKTFAQTIKYEQTNLARSALSSLGKLARQRNDDRQAEKHFRQAIKLTETLRAPLPAEEFRMAFSANKLEPYEELAKIYLKEKKTEKAFLLIENSRSRVLAETLGDESQWQPTNKAASRLHEKLRNLREELNWFYSRLNRAETEEIESLQRETGKLEKQLAELTRQIGSTASRPLRDKTELDLAELQTQLGAERALIEYVVFDNQISAFVVTNQRIEFVESLCLESEILPLLEGLRFQFGGLRYGAEKLRAFLPELKKRADFYLAELYTKLLAPLENFLENRRLTIVPIRELHYVPFNALFDGRKYTIEKREVNYAPSATVLQFCLSKPRRKLENALLVAYADERIPLVRREIEHLQKTFRRTKILAGNGATVSDFTKQAKQFDVLHLGCHGEYRPDNPLFSSLHLADGAITVRDVCSQKLKAGLVTLSACETGLNSIFAGDEILGLTRGFLTAGVSSLVLSLWTVNDEATAELMKSFYGQLQTSSVSESLRLAQIGFIEKGTHPYFWSPFVLIGKW